MNNSYCPIGYWCGAFHEGCTEEKARDCSGQIRPNRASRERFNRIVYPPEKEFFIGKCSILGEETLVTRVNNQVVACKECYRSLIAPRRSSGSNEELPLKLTRWKEEIKKEQAKLMVKKPKLITAGKEIKLIPTHAQSL